MPTRFGMRVCAAIFSLALIGVASASSAHVTVTSPDATAGGFGKLVFRVPTESETASTTRVMVDLPAKTPFAFVSTQAKPGWTVSLTETRHDKPIKVGDFTLTKTVSAVTWTANGSGITPRQFDEFSLSVGPIAKAKSLSFKVKQGYSDHSTVDWDQVQTGKTEPEHPAPTLKLIAEKPQQAKSTDHASRGLAIAALAIAAASYLLGLRNNRRHA
ncbi:MAG: YcnI family protein [Aeromicrobium sp.]